MLRNFEKERRELSDRELMESIVRKDADAFSILYDRHAAKLFGLAIQIVKDRALAEDILQDIFLSLWKNAGQFDPGKGNPLTWLMVLCRNRCIDKLRVRSKKAGRTNQLSEKEAQQAMSSKADNPAEYAIQNETHAIIKDALQQLPAEQRTLIELAYFSGFTQSEIAETSGLPLGTVKTRIRLGMQKLKSIFIST
jgi:RNA polymerase sigma-70 factor (ECF subfamily)